MYDSHKLRLCVLLRQLSPREDEATNLAAVALSSSSVASAGLLLTQPESVGMSSLRLRRIEAFVQDIVREGKTPMATVGVLRHGRLAHLSMAGCSDEARGVSVSSDTIYRMFSMTKPVVSVALLMLYEAGCFESFDEPVARFIPCFHDLHVYISGDTPETLRTRPASTPMTIKHLLTHTSGLGYGFVQDVPAVSKMLSAGVDFGPEIMGREETFQPYSLSEAVERLASLPLLCDPGAEWHYSMSTDVVGRLIEVMSGMSLPDYLQSQIFGPLGMLDTGFTVPEQDVHRFAALYMHREEPGPDGKKYFCIDDPIRSMYLKPLTKGLASGGGGLVSTIPDWLKWMGFLLRKGTAEDGTMLLSPKTFDYMALNHLPGGVDLGSFGAKSTLHKNVIYKQAQGWSLAFAVIQDAASYDSVCSEGELAWGSLAGGYLWVDHKEDIAVIFKTQLMPSAAYPWRRHLHALVYQSLIESSGI